MTAAEDREHRELARQLAKAQATVGGLQRKLAQQARSMQRLADQERERWETAMAPEVDSIRDRVRGRLEKVT